MANKLANADHLLTTDEVCQPTRDPLALAMLAAWLNVTPEQLPEAYKAHTCEATMTAWKRVGDAAVAYVAANSTTPETNDGR